MAKLLRKFTNLTSYEMPKLIDCDSSSTTVFECVDIKKITRKNEENEDEEVYQYTMNYYNKQDWLAEQLAKSTLEVIDPIIDPSADLADIIAKKVTILGNRCTEHIEAGFDCDGKHYSLSTFDQMDIDAQLSNILNIGLTSVCYHADNTLCTMYTAKDFLKVACMAKAVILKHKTYVNHLISMVKQMDDIDEIMAVEYGVTEVSPGEIKKNYDEIVSTQCIAFVDAIKNKTGLDFSDLLDGILE